MGPRLGFAYGHFDVLDVGHVRYLIRARESCEHLVVGVTTDALFRRHRGTWPVVPHMQRMQLVSSLRPVDDVVSLENGDIVSAWQCLRFDVLFSAPVAERIGFEDGATELRGLGVDVVDSLHTVVAEGSAK